jgi:hypothetical protein
VGIATPTKPGSGGPLRCGPMGSMSFAFVIEEGDGQSPSRRISVKKALAKRLLWRDRPKEAWENKKAEHQARLFCLYRPLTEGDAVFKIARYGICATQVALEQMLPVVQSASVAHCGLTSSGRRQ